MDRNTQLDPSGLAVRPTRLRVVGGSALAVFGALFGVAGLSDSDTRILLPAFGLFIAALGLSLATAAAFISGESVRYRYGVIRRVIPVADVESVDVCEGNRGDFVALRLNRRSGKPIKLVGLQRTRTRKGQRSLEEAAVEINRFLAIAKTLA